MRIDETAAEKPQPEFPVVSAALYEWFMFTKQAQESEGLFSAFMS